jgi:hypothetical protein
MDKHTPGPWTYHATAGNHDFSVYPEATGRDVALVRDFNEANARLIAAAPDLLAALANASAAFDAVCEYLDGMCIHHPVKPGRDCYVCDAYASADRARDEARRVLDKAEVVLVD